MRKAAYAAACIALVLGVALGMPASAEDTQAGRMESSIDWGFYDGRILHIAVTQTARNAGEALYSAVILSEANEGARAHGETIFGAYCEAGDVLDGEGNVLPIFLGGHGNSTGKTIQSHFYTEMPEGVSPDEVHVSITTGVVLPGGDELLEAESLTVDLPAADTDIRVEYAFDAEDPAHGGVMRLVHYFLPGKLNFFMLDRTLTPAQATDFGKFVLLYDDREVSLYNGHSNSNDDETLMVQEFFFEPSETPPRALVMELMNGAGTGKVEVTLDLAAAP